MTDCDKKRAIVVDASDAFVGEEEKEKCHEGPGILHRGLLVMVFNNLGELLLIRRSEEKRFWPGFWDGSIAGHVLVGEDYVQAARRRLRGALGISAEDPEFAFKFRYQAAYENSRDHEICAVLIVRGIIQDSLSVSRTESDAIRFVDFKALIKDLRENGGHYSPRLVLALEHISERPLLARRRHEIHTGVLC